MKIRQILSIGCFLWILASLRLAAQQPEIQPLPIDPKIRYGQLNNGLTYYIRHNAQPKDRADFFIAQNVGSILEDENQRGLAHFLEHMAFDGTKNFPGHGMDEFTESIGMRGGENFNAYTSFDETVYMIMNAPVTRESIVDSCLLILHDWSGFITLADTAIEKERGVIREEWRTRQDAQARIWEQQLPKMFPDNKYAYRMPIGTIDVINNFKPDELRDYYKKWYRPDLQGIIIVGDIDVDKVEAAVKRIFADIPAPVNPAKREYTEVADNDKPLVSIATDKEASNMILSIFYKHDKMPKELYATAAGLMKDYMENVVETMINERFAEMMQKADPPFVAAQASDGDFMIAKTKGAFTVAALVKEGEIDKALDALVTETERVKRYGFTASEYDRARINVLKQYESLFNDRDKQKNRSYTNEYVRHFTDGGYIPGIETEYQLISQIAPQIPIEQVNQYAQSLIGDKNIVIGLTGPDKADIKYPTEAQLLEDFIKAQQLPVKPYEETVSNEPLIPELPAPGKIREMKTDPLFGATVLTLDNGIKVVLKHTDFKKDEILMTATSPGGSTLFGAKDIDNLKVFNDVITLGGAGNFSATDLNKVLAGKKVSCSPSIGLNTENVNGYAAPADLKTLFELVYLYFTAPRMDEEAYTSFENRMIAQLKNLELNPMVAFSDTLTKAIYDNNPRAARITADDFKQISYPRIMEMYKERFADASDFVFTFVGNIDTDSIRPFVEQYLATLPVKGRAEKANPAEVPAIRKGEYTNIFKRALETPKASVVNFWSGKMEYNLENILTATMLKQILDLVYMEKVREAYTSFENRMIAQLKNLELNPMVAFSDTLTKAIYDNNPRAARITADDFKQISYPRIMEMYKERFADASDFVFTFVGNIDTDSIRPFVEQYLATLPVKGRAEKANPAEVPAIRKGEYTNIFKRALETPKASVVNFWSGKMEYNLENILTATMLKQILDLVYMEKVREDEGGTYGVQTSAQISSFPEGQTFLQAYFDTDPAKREKMNAIVRTELDNIVKSGPRDEDFKKSQDNILKRHTENLQENVYWLTTLDNYYFRGFNGETAYEETIKGITPAKIQAFAKKLLGQGNRIEVVMEP